MQRGRVSNGTQDLGGEASSAYAYVLMSSLAFATMGALSHLAGERCDWRIVAVARTLLAFLFSLSLAVSTGAPLVFLRPRVLWVRSVAGSLGLLCAFYALTHLPVSTALTLSNTVPVWVTLLAWPALGLRPHASVWAAVAAGVAGIVLIQRPSVSGGENLAGLLALASAFGTATAMIGLNKLGGVDARAVVTHFSGVSTVFTVVFLLLSPGAVDFRPLSDAHTLLLLGGVGLAGTLGQLAMTKAFALGSPSKVSVVGLMQVVFALAYDLLLWRRRFDLLTVCGILLVLAPSAWLMLHTPLRRAAAIHNTTS
ncbi:MAG TPA: DMT family transporter [Pyrinomonadaceae bacterium]|nr:DMT family transporter [Pyrinomonadaceae bacterium]